MNPFKKSRAAEQNLPIAVRLDILIHVAKYTSRMLLHVQVHVHVHGSLNVHVLYSRIFGTEGIVGKK